MFRILSIAAIMSLAFSLAGCMAIGGTSTVQKPTTGQQLVDLKLALDRGAINQAEYDQQKTLILSRRD